MKKREKNELNTKVNRRPASNNDTGRNLCQKNESVEFTQAESLLLIDIAECQCLLFKAESLIINSVRQRPANRNLRSNSSPLWGFGRYRVPIIRRALPSRVQKTEGLELVITPNEAKRLGANGMSAALSTPKRVERLKGVDRETKGSTPSNGVGERYMLFSPPIASLHWGLFKLKTFGLPNTTGRCPTLLIIRLSALI